MLHAAGVCHADLKQRNIVRSKGGVLLVDLDAALRMGEPFSRAGKVSTAYCAPELARIKFCADAGEADQVVAAESYDVWHYGVVLYELLAGRALFSQDTANDALVDAADRTKLCVWHTCPDEILQARRPPFLAPSPDPPQYRGCVDLDLDGLAPRAHV